LRVNVFVVDEPRQHVERAAIGGVEHVDGGLLDQWWGRLAERLNGETCLPALPGEVSQAFVAVWQQAIHLAQSVAEQAFSEQRKVLATERDRVASVENQARQDAALARQHAVAAQAA
jgi:hypothetical protein